MDLLLPAAHTVYMGAYLIRKRFLLGPYARPMPMGTSLMRKRLPLRRPIYRGTSLIRKRPLPKTLQ